MKRKSEINKAAATTHKNVEHYKSYDSALISPPRNLKPFRVPKLIGIDARDGTTTTRPLSELGNAMRLKDNFAGEIFYIQEMKSWIFWDGDAWQWCGDNAKVKMLAIGLPEQIYIEGNQHIANAEHFAKWSRKSQQERTIDATISILQDFDEIRLPFANIDADTFIIGFDGGKQLIELKTGMGRKAEKIDYITKALNISSIGTAQKAFRWIEFLNQIFNGDAELIDWFKRWCGYMLTGSTNEQILVFCYGLGANGKSVLADLLRHILGDYGRAINSETLTESNRKAGSATPDLADLIGARMVMSAETEDGTALAESLVKSMVSGDVMSVRKLYAAPVQFQPQFKLMILGNHKPIIKGNDYGVWRRVRLIPFTRTFKPEDRDVKLLEKLKAEAPHILAWMVEGCLKWQEIGLADVPKVIEQATNDYQVEQDLIGRWLSECCEESAIYESLSTDIYKSYQAWCFDNGLKVASNIALGRRLSERGYKSAKVKGSRGWLGIRVKDTAANHSFNHSTVQLAYRQASGR